MSAAWRLRVYWIFAKVTGREGGLAPALLRAASRLRVYWAFSKVTSRERGLAPALVRAAWRLRVYWTSAKATGSEGELECYAHDKMSAKKLEVAAVPEQRPLPKFRTEW